MSMILTLAAGSVLATVSVACLFIALHKARKAKEGMFAAPPRPQRAKAKAPEPALTH